MNSCGQDQDGSSADLDLALDAIGVLADDGVQFDREAVELAAWFHDAVYEIGRDDNEDQSIDEGWGHGTAVAGIVAFSTMR